MLLLLTLGLPHAPLHEPEASHLVGTWAYGPTRIICRADGTCAIRFTAGDVPYVRGNWTKEGHVLQLVGQGSFPDKHCILRHATRDYLVVDWYSPALEGNYQRIILSRVKE